MPLRNSLAALGVFLLVSLPVHGDFFITVESTTIAAGSQGYVNVFIRYDGTGNNILSGTAFQFQIVPAGVVHGELQFTDSPKPENDPTFSSGKYVFPNDNSYVRVNNNVNYPLGNAFQSTTGWSNDSITGNDKTISPDPFVNVSVSGIDTLLAKLPVTASTTASPIQGDAFTINLIPSGTSYYINGDTGTPFSFSNASSGGTVTIGAAVPEPSSLVLLSLFAGSSFVAWAVKRKRASSCIPRNPLPVSE